MRRSPPRCAPLRLAQPGFPTLTSHSSNRISQEEIMSCRTNCCKTFSLIFVLLALAILATPAFAQNTCLQNEYNLAAGLSATSTAQSNSLNCTANDVRIAQV